MKNKTTITIIILIVLLTLAACTGSDTSPIDFEGSKWSLTEINGQPPLEGSNVTIEFDDGQVSGNASCNSYGGDYTTTNDGSIEFGLMMSTMMACMEPEGMMEQESAYLLALAQAKSFQVEGEQLTIEDESGNALLVFEQVVTE